jgi:hypothetical protein
MDFYPKLTDKPDENGHVHFLANKTRGNYLNLRGAQTKNTLDAVYSFMIKYKIWSKMDTVLQVKKPADYVPNSQNYHDISFVLIFYEMASKISELKGRAQIEQTKEEVDQLYSRTDFGKEIIRVDD